jgi:hypothetical protein
MGKQEPDRDRWELDNTGPLKRRSWSILKKGNKITWNYFKVEFWLTN